MYDTVIIGAGTAGLTAAIYARRAGKSVLVLEKAAYGGQIINTPEIENYPAAPHISGFEFAAKLYEQAKETGTEFVFEKAVGLRADTNGKTVLTGKNAYAAKTVILAAGTVCRKLGLEKEEALVGKGVSYCAACDGAFYRKKTVAVIGGGNTALEDALYLSDLAETVYLVHRRDSFRGEEAAVSLLKAKENVRFLLGCTVTKLHAGERLERIEVTSADGTVQTLPVDGVFAAIGRIPANQDFAPQILLDEAGYVIAGENCHTNMPGVFVAGDARTKTVRQLVTAAADGAVAAAEAIRFLSESEKEKAGF